MSIDGVVFGDEGGLLDHADENHSSDPELNLQQFTPVEGAPNEPEHGEESVDATHHSVEEQGRVLVRSDVTTVSIPHRDHHVDVERFLVDTREQRFVHLDDVIPVGPGANLSGSLLRRRSTSIDFLL